MEGYPLVSPQISTINPEDLNSIRSAYIFRDPRGPSESAPQPRVMRALPQGASTYPINEEERLQAKPGVPPMAKQAAHDQMDMTSYQGYNGGDNMLNFRAMPTRSESSVSPLIYESSTVLPQDPTTISQPAADRGRAKNVPFVNLLPTAQSVMGFAPALTRVKSALRDDRTAMYINASSTKEPAPYNAPIAAAVTRARGPH